MIFLASQRLFHQRIDLCKKRRPAIVHFYLFAYFYTPFEAIIYQDITDFQMNTLPFEWNYKVHRLSIHSQEPVSIHPTLPDVIQVVVENEFINCRNELEIAKIGEKVGLKNREFHDTCIWHGIATTNFQYFLSYRVVSWRSNIPANG